MCLLFQTYCHQTPRQAPTVHPCSHTVVAVIAHGRLRQFPAGSSRLSKPNRVHLSLRSIWFSRLLPTPPRGDAVTSSSRRHIGCRRPRFLTLEEDTALQRTGTPVARRPPRRSLRAVLPHKAPQVDAQSGCSGFDLLVTSLFPYFHFLNSIRLSRQGASRSGGGAGLPISPLLVDVGSASLLSSAS